MHTAKLLVIGSVALVLGLGAGDAAGQSTRDGKDSKRPSARSSPSARAKADAKPAREISPEEQVKRERARQARLVRIRHKLDVNGDGRISGIEWRAASEEWKDFDKEFEITLARLDAQARRALIKTLDGDGDGRLSEGELSVLRERVVQSRLEMIEKFDGDADGKLSGEERRSLAKALDEAKQAPVRGRAASMPERRSESRPIRNESEAKQAAEAEQRTKRRN